jgi:hypothetical protein
MDVLIKIEIGSPLLKNNYYIHFIRHKNGETDDYRKIKIGALIMNNNCILKQWVARYHMDVLIKIEIGIPF